MMTVPRRRLLALLGALGLLAAVPGLPLVLPALAGLDEIPPPSPDGRFEGTWFRSEPGARQVVWLRHDGRGKSYELRLYWSTDQGLEFDSGWKTRAEFTYRGFAGLFDLEIDRKASSSDLLLLHYRREQDGARGSHLVETGDVRLQRVGDMGWELAWIQQPLKSVVTVAEPVEQEQARVEKEGERRWLFLKASHRILPLDEIPW